MPENPANHFIASIIIQQFAKFVNTKENAPEKSGASNFFEQYFLLIEIIAESVSIETEVSFCE